MQVNQLITLEITDLDDNANAIGKIDSLTVFLDKGVIGDVVEAKIEKIKKNYITAKLKKIIRASKIRQEQKICDVQDSCGGCQILDIKYEEQLKIKHNLVKQKLERIGSLYDVCVKDVVAMENPFRYRNKTQIPLRMKNDNVQIGFYKQKSHDIVAFNDCKIQKSINNKIIDIIKKFIKKQNIKIYDETTHSGNLRHIITKISHNKDEIMLILVTKQEQKLDVNYLVQEFDKNNINCSIIQNINSKKTNVILSNENLLLYGRKYIQDTIDDIVFNIYPNSFYQVNSIQMEKMYKKALEYADIKGDETVYDLYCGIGTISLLFAKKCKQVYGIEVVEEAIKSAKENAIQNNIQNVEFICAKVEDEIDNLIKSSKKADVIILDPARKGCEKKVLDSILKLNTKKIIYISCNPSTLARDLKILLEDGRYKLKEVSPYDLFCHTMHIENVALIERI